MAQRGGIIRSGDGIILGGAKFNYAQFLIPSRVYQRRLFGIVAGQHRVPAPDSDMRTHPHPSQ